MQENIYIYLNKASQGFSIPQSYGYGDVTNLGDAFTKLVGPTFSIAAVILIIYFAVGSYKYIRSAGDKNEVQGAQQMILHALIGFMLLMLMFLMMQFIPQFFKLEGFSIVKTK